MCSALSLPSILAVLHSLATPQLSLVGAWAVLGGKRSNKCIFNVPVLKRFAAFRLKIFPAKKFLGFIPFFIPAFTTIYRTARLKKYINIVGPLQRKRWPSINRYLTTKLFTLTTLTFVKLQNKSSGAMQYSLCTLCFSIIYNLSFTKSINPQTRYLRNSERVIM